MSLLTIKATSLLLIITLVFSSYGVAEATNLRGLIKPFTGAGKSEVTVPESTINRLLSKTSSTTRPTFPKGTPKDVQLTLIKAYEVAKKASGFFGPAAYKKGFSYAWKGYRYYLKVADKCEKYSNSLNIQCKPHPDIKLRDPGCVAKYCIVVASNMLDKKTPPICYNDCELPKEALCKATRTINKNCGRIDVKK